MSNPISERLQSLRDAMKASGVYAAVIPHVDPHQSEYIADHWQVRRWLSGFTGSAGNLVITADRALLWVDSRYFLQGAQQIAGTPFELMKDGLKDTPSITEWLCKNVPSGSVVGIDGLLFSHAAVVALEDELATHAVVLVTDFDPIDSIWLDRPAVPSDKILLHDEKYAGESASSKIKAVLADAASQGAEAVLLGALDEIAWTLNIRSTDVPCNPVVTSFLLLAPEGSVLFVDPVKVTPEVSDYLAAPGVTIRPYDCVLDFLSSYSGGKVLVQENRIAHRLWSALRGNAVGGSSPVAMPKACKNPVQIAGIRAAMERDGVALVKSIMEIERKLGAGERITEMGVCDILKKYRSEQPLYFDISFETICGYGAHGAIVHYDPTPETDIEIEPHGLLLIDSGANYLDGTTDITRTIALAPPTRLEKSDFTLVMKGYIALDQAVYPVGTRGSQLDVLARQYLWKNGLSYLHGTGHGVGHFLNVHEGPQGIRLNDIPVALKPGMVTSDEPGLYRENVHGIRCENLVLTVPAFTTEFGEFLKFETLTLFPFDRQLFDLDMMTPEEIRWVDEYHQRVFDRLSPMLSPDEQKWLAEKTLPLGI